MTITIVTAEIPPIEVGPLLNDLEDAVLAAAEAMQADYLEVTSTWVNQPEFDFDINIERGRIEVLVGTNDQVFEWVNDGTGNAAGHRATWYPIEPRTKQALAYPKDFSPKTTPGIIGSQPGGKFGETIQRSIVFHPGIEPRLFNEEITQKHQPLFSKRIQRALIRSWQNNWYRRMQDGPR